MASERPVAIERPVASEGPAQERVKLVVDLQEGRLAAGSVSRSLAGPTPTPDQVLATYLSLIYTLRHTEPGTPITLRTGDLDVLAEVLRLAEGDVERRLTDLMADRDGEIVTRKRLLRGRVVVPVAGLLVAVTAAGALILVTDRDSTDAPATVQVPNPDGSSTQVHIGDEVPVGDLGPGDVGLATPQVAVPGPDGGVVQSARTGDTADPGDAATTTTTTTG